MQTLPYPKPKSGIQYARNVLAAEGRRDVEIPMPTDDDLLESAWNWADEVIEGKVVSCKEMRRVVRRHRELFVRGGDDHYYFCEKSAKRVIRFAMARMRLKDGDWDERPFVPLPWQVFYLANLFGWKNRETKCRKYRRSFICTGKASGKNILLATAAYYLEIADGEGSPQIVVAAATAAQARNVFDSITWSIEVATPGLVGHRLQILGGSRSSEVIDHQTNGWIRRISGDTKGRGSSGYNLSGLVIDELHEHQSRELKDILISGLGKARKQALCLMATNAGGDTVGHAYEEFRYAQNVANFDTNERYFPWLCHIEEGDDPRKDKSCWLKANPSYPITPTYLEERVAEMAGSKVRERHILRLNFGIWDQGGAVTWLQPDQWDVCLVDERPEWIEDRMPCWLGVDLSRRSDLTSIAVAWWNKQKKSAHVEVTSWMPNRKAADVTSELGIPFIDWGQLGELILSDDGTISYGQLVGFMSDIHLQYPIQQIAADAWQINDLVEDANILNFPIHVGDFPPKGSIQLAKHAQGYYTTKEAKLSMGLSIAATEDLALNGKLTILRNAPLRMAQQSALVVMDGKANRMFKKMAQMMRIDPLVAMVMAIGNVSYANRNTAPAGNTLADLNRITRAVLEDAA